RRGGRRGGCFPARCGGGCGVVPVGASDGRCRSWGRRRALRGPVRWGWRAGGLRWGRRGGGPRRGEGAPRAEGVVRRSCAGTGGSGRRGGGGPGGRWTRRRGCGRSGRRGRPGASGTSRRGTSGRGGRGR